MMRRRFLGVRAAAAVVLIVAFAFPEVVVVVQSEVVVSGVCPNDCSGHGDCDIPTKSCICLEGFGASSDVAIYKAPDCSMRVCPSGRSFGDVPTGSHQAHAFAECSDAGICDRNTGKCQCFDSYFGKACQFMKCPAGCSGHGECKTMRRLAQDSSALPLSEVARYDEAPDTWSWDQDSMLACVCDSSWEVGLGSGQRQSSTYFGFDCSLRHCPSGDDPLTDEDEEDCEGKSLNGKSVYGAVGQPGNKCHVDCSNRGKCDHSSGVCACFPGYKGAACNIQDARAGAE